MGTAQEFTHIQVNGIPHQNVMDVDERLKVEAVYGKPYERAGSNPLNNVLIVGAGTGTDGALALEDAAGRFRVDAPALGFAREDEGNRGPRNLQLLGDALHGGLGICHTSQVEDSPPSTGRRNMSGVSSCFCSRR